MGFRAYERGWDSGFRVRVYGVGCRILGLEFRVQVVFWDIGCGALPRLAREHIEKER